MSLVYDPYDCQKALVDLSRIVQPSFHSKCVYNNYPKAKIILLSLHPP